VTAVAVLGLGEAGGRLAADLVAAGADVRGYDPDPGVEVAGLTRAPDVGSAVSGTDVVLSVNSAAVAAEAAVAALPALGSAVYADLNTAAPASKRELAAVVERFADVALLGPVPTTGLRTPALASGAAAQPFADALGPLGMPVEVVSDRAGDAATLKLLRSVFMKGLAASVVESLEAAEAADQREWLAGQIAEVIGEPLRDRLVEGSRRHAVRRAEEMEAARELLGELGVEPRIASASAALLAEMAAASR
jgi:3-hydroxyisobutyrate dehydrogenase-like beta-hydroxyacid dehydrogenase